MDQEKRQTLVDSTYKSVLIINDTSDANITLFLYESWARACWVSYLSKIILPGDKYLYRSKGCFKYELQASSEKGRKTIVLKTRKWEQDKAFSVTDSLEVIESNLADHEQEQRIYIRRLNKEEEITSEGGRNLYALLKLDMKEVRKLDSVENQNEVIKKAFHREIHRWHPDSNPDGGDNHMAHEVCDANKILRDPEKRAQYHNTADYDKGWWSWSRWKSIFKPECATIEQKKEYWKRLYFLALSFGLGVGGLALSMCTAGMALPVVIAGAVGGGALLGGGVLGGLRTVKRESIKNGCDTMKFVLSFLLGAMGGAIGGAAAAAITAGIAGVGSAAVEAAELTMAQYLAIGSAAGATGGAISSVTIDLERMLVSGEEVTAKQFLGHVACAVVIGVVAGVAGGAVNKAVAGQSVTATAANLKGEALEQVAIVSGAKRFGNAVAKGLGRAVTENSAGAVMDVTAHIIEERLDDSVENQSAVKHLKDVAENAAFQFAKDGISRCASALGSFLLDDDCGAPRHSKKDKAFTINDSENGNEHDIERKQKTIKNDKWTDWNKSYNYQILEFEKADHRESQSESLCGTPLQNLSEDIVNTGRVRYISEGKWESKMVVSYKVNGNLVTKTISGSSSSIELPENAREIEVLFKVLRGPWCDVKKFDRFNGYWCKPTEAHVFRYDVPPIRTFTISGPLYYEAVMKVIDENFDELDE